MGEQSKKPVAKQVSIAAFFSPKGKQPTKPKPVTKPAPKPTAVAVAVAMAVAVESEPESPAPLSVDAFKTPSPAAQKGKRKRQTRSAAKKKLQTEEHAEDAENRAEWAEEKGEESEAENQVVDLTTPADTAKTQKKHKPIPKAKAKATPKVAAKATTKIRTKTSTPPAVRYGVSPHERTGDDDDDDDDEEEEEEETTPAVEKEANQAMAASAMGTTTAAAPLMVDDDDDGDVEIVAVATPATTTVAAPKARAATSKKKTSTATTESKPTKVKKVKDQPTVAPPAPSLSLSLSPSGSPQKTSAAAQPLDPVVRARISNYQQKVDELTQLCARLALSAAADDAVLREIYGVGLDLDLDLDPADDRARAARSDTWRAIIEATLLAPTDLPAALKQFVARAIQGRGDSLTALVERIAEALSPQIQASAASLLALEMEIKMLAQRSSYGARPAKANLYEDTTAEALWCWEVNNVELHFSEDAQKTIKRLRKQRKRTGAQLKSLTRAVQLLHQSPIDEAKVSNEEAKIGKFVSQVEAELLKARDREKKDEEKTRKEQEKAHAHEEKKRLDHEKQLAKEEDKRKREIEAEAERTLAEKRRKSMVSYFRSIDTVHEPISATANVVTVAAIIPGVTVGVVSGGTRLSPTRQLRKMARMDREVSYLVNNPNESTDTASSPPSRSGPALLQRQRALVTARVGHWSARQHCDEKLGPMKLLQFHENHRPAYVGTFSKRSRVFRRGRRPLAAYPKFDYSVDSEEEWEEEEPGESLSDADSDMDGEDEDDQLDYGDDWLAYEDEVEYVDGKNHDDDDVVMEEDGDADGDDDVVSAASRKRRRRRVVAENKKQKLIKLVPQMCGPFVCCDPECSEHLSSYRAELLEPTLEFVSTLMKRAQAQAAAAAVAAEAAAAVALKKDREATAATTAATPAKKKTKTTTDASVVTLTSATVVTMHKPPVKRKISAQFQSVSSSNDSSPALLAATASAPTIKKKADNSTRTVISPVKSGISGWLKTPTAPIAGPESAAEASLLTAKASPSEEISTAASSSSTKAPVEI